MRSSLFVPRPLLWLLWVLFLALGAHAQAGRVVYLLAGQSNMERLWRSLPTTASPCTTTGGLATNVTYWEPNGPFLATGRQPFALDPRHPVALLGDQLGAQHPGQSVELMLIARSGSALLARNFISHAAAFGINGAWVDENDLFNPFTWPNLMQPMLTSLGLTSADELHILWNQGESDCIVGMTTSEDDYAFWSQAVFAQLAFYCGKFDYDVHLATIGWLNDPNFDDTLANSVRDAYFHMPANPIVFPGFAPQVEVVAHHYDLPHDATVHLSHCSYLEFAQRIAAGIAAPSSLPRVTAGVAVTGGTDITVATNQPLAAIGFGTLVNPFFDVRVGGVQLAQTAFQVSAGAGGVVVRVPAGGVTSTNCSVRYVAGTGQAFNWPGTTSLKDATNGVRLEPFVAP